MNTSVKLVFSDEASFPPTKGGVLVFLAILLFGFSLALASTDAPNKRLSHPMRCSDIHFGLWVGLLGIAAGVRRFEEKRAIDRLFTGEIWEC